jgi:hypothetical protein
MWGYHGYGPRFGRRARRIGLLWFLWRLLAGGRRRRRYGQYWGGGPYWGGW